MIFFLLGIGLELQSGSMPNPAPQPYYTVITVSGVNLRVKPQTNSRILFVLPVNSSGKILEYVSEKPVKIQGRNGFWVKAEYGKNVGYLFTGFVEISEGKSRTLDADAPTYLEESPQYRILEKEEVRLYLKQKIYEKTEFPGHTLYITKAPPRDIGEDPQCIGRSELRLGMIHNKKNGKYYDLDAVYVERVRGAMPYPDQLVLDITHCSCCCGSRSVRSFFFGKEKVLVAPFSFKKRPAQCGADRSQESLEWRFESNSQRILIQMKTPFCSFSSENHDIDFKNPEIRNQYFLEIQKVDGEYVKSKHIYPGETYSNLLKEWSALAPSP